MSEPADRLFTGRYRAMQYVSFAYILFTCVLFALLLGKYWSWGPFILAPVIVAIGAGANAQMARKAISWLRPTEEHLRRAASRRRVRNRVTLPAYITFGIGFGLIAGSIPSYWADAALAALILLMSVLVPLAMLPALKRRAEAQRPAGPDAN
jgi:MFS family permease